MRETKRTEDFSGPVITRPSSGATTRRSSSTATSAAATRDDALECAQSVVVRLLSELKRGKSYRVPFRVVVHKVIEWTTKGFYERGRAILVELEDDVLGDGNPFDDIETQYDLERALEALPEGDREVARLRLLEGIEIDEIAERLG